MRRSWRSALLPVRDFACALAVFAMFFVILEADRTYFFPPPVLSLISTGVAPEGIPDFRDWGRLGNPIVHVVHSSSTIAGPFIIGLLAVAFSTIVTINLAVVRHLRRVHASSRRGAWRES